VRSQRRLGGCDIAALEVAAAPLDTGAIAGAALAGSAGAGLVAFSGELYLLVGHSGECFFGRVWPKAAIADDLP
jgi:hypothetical protein